MTQIENTTESRKGKHLGYEEHLKIEAWRKLDTIVQSGDRQTT